MDKIAKSGTPERQDLWVKIRKALRTVTEVVSFIAAIKTLLS